MLLKQHRHVLIRDERQDFCHFRLLPFIQPYGFDKSDGVGNVAVFAEFTPELFQGGGHNDFRNLHVFCAVIAAGFRPGHIIAGKVQSALRIQGQYGDYGKHQEGYGEYVLFQLFEKQHHLSPPISSRDGSSRTPCARRHQV